VVEAEALDDRDTGKGSGEVGYISSSLNKNVEHRFSKGCKGTAVLGDVKCPHPVVQAMCSLIS